MIALLVSPVYANGPRYGFTDPKLDDEFQNVYHDISTKASAVGTHSGDSATTGMVGEYVSSYATATSAPTTGQFGDLTSISLSAGDWDVSLSQLGVVNGATITRCFIGVGYTSGNNVPDVNGQFGDDSTECSAPTSSNVNFGAALPDVRVSITTTRTLYYKMYSEYIVATPQFRGRISARRVR